MKALIPGGLLLAVEGIDGAGKTSTAALLAQYCGERAIACTLSKEPTSLKWGTELRRSAQAGRLTLDEELRLFRLDRAMHVRGTIQPALDAGWIVIVDRYYWSSAAYQGARGAGRSSGAPQPLAWAPTPERAMRSRADSMSQQVCTDALRVARIDAANFFVLSAKNLDYFGEKKLQLCVC